MSEFSAARAPRGADKAAVTAEKRPFFRKLLDLVVPSPGSRDQLIESLAVAENKELIEPESRMMLEGVIRMADMTAGDVMVASRHMDLLDINAPFEEMLHVIIHTGHSRFPVFEERRDNVIGILMAKDLLKLQRSPDLNLRTFDVPDAVATHVRITALENQCTGTPGYQGEQDADPLNATDCDSASDQGTFLHAAELEVFGANLPAG